MRLPKLLVAIGFSFAAAAATAACIAVDYSDQPFLCDPGGASPTCPKEYKCCSDDPAAMTEKSGEVVSVPGALPGLNKNTADGKAGDNDFGEPLFAGENNRRSRTGMCVRPGSLELTINGTEAEGCPIPCNPQWTSSQVEAVCGRNNSVCCQTVEITAKDCVEDEMGCSHPATGANALAGDVSWPKELDTPQSHGGCKAWKEGSDPYRSCIRELGVATSRGFCIAPGSDGKPKACPLAGKPNICEQRNAEGCN